MITASPTPATVTTECLWSLRLLNTGLSATLVPYVRNAVSLPALAFGCSFVVNIEVIFNLFMSHGPPYQINIFSA